MSNNSSSAHATITVCTTCRSFAEPKDLKVRAGSRLLCRLREAMFAKNDGNYEIKGFACLWACGSGCAVYISAPQKPGYLIGHLHPENLDVIEILDYVKKYENSPNGVVDYDEWPSVVHNRFLARIPVPMQYLDESDEN